MKLAYLTDRFPCAPGEEFCAGEVAELVSLAHDVVVLPTRPRRTQLALRDGRASVLRLSLFGPRTLAMAVAEFCLHPIAVAAVVARLFSTQPVPVCELAVLPKALAVAWTLRRRRIEHIHALWLSTPSTIGYVASELTGIPWSCSAHYADALGEGLLGRKVSSARFIRAISRRAREILLERTGDGIGERCHVVHLGVNVPARFHTPHRRRTIDLLCAADFTAREGHVYLLQALALLMRRGAAFTCDLAGDGPLLEEVKRFAHELGLSQHLRFCPAMPNEVRLSRLQRGFYDLVVSARVECDDPSAGGIPRTLMEAMAVGVPCIATDTSGASELIDNRRCSRIVAQADPTALAAAIYEFAQHPEQHAELARSARRRICDAFDVRLTTRSLCELMGAS